MKTSESIKEIATALSKAQAEIAGAKKDSTNPHFKSSYADLASIWDAIRVPLTKHGLSVVQMTEPSDKDEIIVVTRVCHLSGEWIEGRLAMPVSKADAQGFMSALTYARRGSLAAATGVAQIDDDGNLAAAAKPPKVQKNTDNGFGGTVPITAAQASVDAFDGLDTVTKDYCLEHSKSIIHLWETKGDMLGYIEAQSFDVETKLALWHLLPSQVRSAIKHQQQVAALTKKQTPSLAEQA